MIANARMYAVTPAVSARWNDLFAALFARARVPVTLFDHPPPAPVEDLWLRDDMAAVFMCGLPYSLAQPRPTLIVAPVPSPAEYAAQPRYWSEFVVRADSGFTTVEQTFGHRLALTVPGSQSGCIAALDYLMPAGGSRPLYAQVIAPQVTPLGVMGAVLRGDADIAPIDSYALALLRRHQPELTAQLRTIACTDATPNPPLVATPPLAPALRAAFLDASRDARVSEALSDLLLAGFAAPEPGAYDLLADRRNAVVDYWRRHLIAERVDPAFEF